MIARGFRWGCAFVTAAVLLSQTTRADDASPFVRPMSSPPDQPCNYEFPSRIPIQCWPGLQFIGMPVIKSRRPVGRYLTIDSHAMLANEHPSFDDLTGKLVTITNVVQEHGVWVVYFKTDSYSVPLWTKASSPKHHDDLGDPIAVDLALLRDLQAARQLFLGKTCWIKTSKLPSLRDNDDAMGNASVKFRKFSQVTISDVVVSTNLFAPVRLVIKNDLGEEGFLDISVSPTNRSQTFDEEFLKQISWNYYLSRTDPKVGRDWPDAIWKLIEDEKVGIGMTMEQARLSWGDPPQKIVSKDVAGHAHEEWTYPNHNHIRFVDGQVSSIQN
jgi:hypothetical protein